MRTSNGRGIIVAIFLLGVTPVQGQTTNPLKIALQKWYSANRYFVATLPTSATGGANVAMFDGLNMWVGTNNGTVVRFNQYAQTFTSVSTSAVSPLSMAFDGRNVWVANYDSGKIDKIEASMATLKSTTQCGTNAEGIVFDGTKIWVAHCNGGSNGGIQSIDPDTGVASSTYAMNGCCAQGLTFDGTYLWVACWQANKLIKILPGSSSGTDIALSYVSTTGMVFDGANVWASNGAGNTVTKVRISDNAVTYVTLTTAISNASPRGMAFDGDYVWVAWRDTSSGGHGYVSRIKTSDNSKVDFDLGAGVTPRGVAFDGTNIWITDTNNTYLCSGSTCNKIFKF